MKRALAVLCALALAGCEQIGQQPRPEVVNSFCQTYQRVIRSEEEGASLASAHREVKERVAANDTLFRCECEGWTNPICKKS